MDSRSSVETLPRERTWGGLGMGMFLCVLAVGAGLLSALAPATIALTAAASLGMAISFDMRRAVLVGLAGWAAAAASTLTWAGHSATKVMAVGALAVAAGLMAGSSYRSQRRASPPAELSDPLPSYTAGHEGANSAPTGDQWGSAAHDADPTTHDAEPTTHDAEPAAHVAEPAAREVYAALAQSLEASWAHLDAAEGVLESGGNLDEAAELIRQARSLAVRGLQETVEALNEAEETRESQRADHLEGDAPVQAAPQ
jgi:hypothetical protein